MKKITYLFLFLTILLTLTACENNAAVSENNSESISISESSAVSKTEQPPSGYAESKSDITENDSVKSAELELLTKDGDNNYCGVVCGTNDGAYIMRYKSINDNVYGNFLTYVDYASKQEVYVCTDSSCKHDNEHCAAYFSEGEFYTQLVNSASRIFVLDGKLYYLSSPYDDDGGFSSQSPDENAEVYHALPPALYRMNFDGTEREKILEFKKDEAAESFVVGEGDDYLWLITKTPTAEKTPDGKMYYIHSQNRALIKFSIKEKSIVERIPLDDIDSVTPRFEAVAGGKFIFVGYSFPDGKSPLEAYVYHDFEADDAPSAEEIERQKTCEKVYYALNTADRTIKEFLRLKNNEVYAEAVCGDEICFMNGEYSGFKINPKTGERMEISDFRNDICFNSFRGSKLLLDRENGIDGILCENAEKVLVYRETFKEPHADGGGRGLGYDLMLISLDDLRNGVPNYENVQTIGEWL